MKNLFISLISSFLLFSCASTPDAPSNEFTNLSYQGGLKIYQQRCVVCHGEKGEGLKDLYPPVANSDYMIEHKNEIPCIIKNGLEGEIVVNGKMYNGRMIKHSDLSEMEVADLMTFLLNSWEMNEGNYTKEDVRELLKNCNPE